MAKRAVRKNAVEHQEMLAKAKMLYLTNPEGVSDIEMGAYLGIDRSNARALRNKLHGIYPPSAGKYTMYPSDEEIKLAEAVLHRARIAYPTSQTEL